MIQRKFLRESLRPSINGQNKERTSPLFFTGKMADPLGEFLKEEQRPGKVLPLGV